METQSEINNKQQNFKHSVILNTVSIDELKSQQFNETLVDRSRQRQLFEQKNNKLQHSHHGDTEILESSIHDASVTLNELKQLLKTDTQNKASGADQANSLELKNEGINNDVIEVQIINEQSSQDKQAQNQIENMVSSELEIKKQLSNNYLDAGKKSMNVQDKSNTIDSQNITVNGGQLSTGAIKQSQKNDLRNSKQIWLQEDIFYEKNLKKLGTKVTTKLKGQYQVHKDNVRSSKYKQNFLKATNIINRLLNTSMSRVVKIRQHVQNFVSLLKVRHFNRKADDLSENECQSINDLSHFYFSIEKKRQNKNISTLIDLFDRLSKHLPIFMPTDLYRVIWDMIQVIYIYSFLYIYSLLIFFDQENFNSQQLNNICFYSFINFFADIIINLNTAIFNKDTIIDKRKLIVKQYLFSTVFITDILTMIVLSSRLFQQNHLSVENKKDSLFKYVFNVLVFLKVNGISQKKKRFDYIITLSENQKHVIRLINQIASVMAVAHLAAIGWYFLGVQELKSDQHSWLDKLEISNQAYYQKYVYSIYWAITTMTTGFSFQKLF